MDYYEDIDRLREEQEEEFRARPYRFFYRFKTRNYDDIGAGYEVDELMLSYLRNWASTGEISYWRIIRVADNVTLASWFAPMIDQELLADSTDCDQPLPTPSPAPTPPPTDVTADDRPTLPKGC